MLLEGKFKEFTELTLNALSECLLIKKWMESFKFHFQVSPGARMTPVLSIKIYLHLERARAAVDVLLTWIMIEVVWFWEVWWQLSDNEAACSWQKTDPLAVQFFRVVSGVILQGSAYSLLLKSILHFQGFSSVAQSCLTICDPMNRSTPGLPVHHQLPEFTQTHVHRVSDAIQPSHPLLSPSPPAPNPSQHHW